MIAAARPLLEVRGLQKHFAIRRPFLQRILDRARDRQPATKVRAVEKVDFDLAVGECLGLVGESGSGKTTAGRCILRALEPTAGRVIFRRNGDGDGDGDGVDVATASQSELKRLRRHMQMIFQDPYSSLNPRMTVGDIVAEPLICNRVGRRRERHERVAELFQRVGLKPQHMIRYPHAFSGGQRQRIGIARALALEPRLIVADEPVSALDVSVQAQVLNLLKSLQEELGLTYLFIAHDLSVVRHICDRVAVMYVGRLVELAGCADLFRKPLHPYTEALLSAAPQPVPGRRANRILLPGEVADPANPPQGCHFHPRCGYAREECHESVPELRELAPGRQVRCHLAEELDLRGCG
jgi:oligopeptide/dipeptide ABC transporter ATP-binding protein